MRGWVTDVGVLFEALERWARHVWWWARHPIDRTRWLVADQLNRRTPWCWPDILTWADPDIPGHEDARWREIGDGSECKAEADEIGFCWCGKYTNEAAARRRDLRLAEERMKGEGYDVVLFEPPPGVTPPRDVRRFVGRWGVTRTDDGRWTVGDGRVRVEFGAADWGLIPVGHLLRVPRPEEFRQLQTGSEG